MITWRRVNYRGRVVDLRGGLWLGLWLVVAAALGRGTTRQRASAAAAIGLAGLVGLIDDHFGDSQTKGLRGHLTALVKGHFTTGGLKIVGLAGAGWLVAVGQPAPTKNSATKTAVAGPAAKRGLDALLVAISANLINLFDLRPGRAMKAASLPLLLAAAGPGRAMAGATAAGIALALPGDLSERTMLGDCGAAALGTAIAIAQVRSGTTKQKTLLAGGALALTLLSERVSFSRLINQVKALGWLDQLGRTP